MNILITGGAGFIGSNLADRLLLNKENKILVIDNFNDFYNPSLKEENIVENLKNPNYKLFKGDICDEKFLTKVFKKNDIDCVIHIAAQAGVRASVENPAVCVKNNIDGTVNILEQMRLNGIKKLIFASSSSVYGNCRNKKFSEDITDLKPISPYAATKLACEQIIYTYQKLYDINSVCLRFFSVYGPRQRPDLAIRKFITLISEDKPIPVFGDGTTERDYTYIDDIVDGICSAIEYNKTPYEIINLGYGAPITLNNMIIMLEHVLGTEATIERLPMQEGDVERTMCDITKAQELLGYAPKTAFFDGVRKCVDSILLGSNVR